MENNYKKSCHLAFLSQILGGTCRCQDRQSELADTHPGHLVCTGTKTRITVTGYEYGLGRGDRQLEIAETHQSHLVCRDKTRIADYGHTLGRQDR